VARQTAEASLRQAVPYADALGWRVTADIRFVDAGGNFESVACPRCGSDLGEWWSMAMEAGHQERFRALRVTTPCCRLRTSLHDLSYTPPAGFARAVLEAVNPSVAVLPDRARERVEEALASRVRVIWAFY
jgi:hypothetical protein